MPRHHKVHELLSREELDELDAFAREPGRTVDECHEWMLARGFTLSRSAVGNWKSEFDGLVLQERFSRSGELAAAMKSAVTKGSFEDITDAAVMQLAQVVFEQSISLQGDGKTDPLDVQRMTKSLNNLALTKGQIRKQLAEKYDREMEEQRKKRPDGVVTAEAIAAARKKIFGV